MTGRAARTNTKFAQLRGDLKDFATAKEMRGTVWGAAASAVVAILGVLIALISFGGDRFDAGLGMADVRQAQIDRDKKQDESVREITQKLDELIAAQRSKPSSK